jgi:hypothetical protein
MPQQQRLPRIFPGSLAAVALSAALVLPGAAQADWQEVTITKVVTKQLVVHSNGSSYTQVPLLANLIADLRVEADAGDWGEIKEWTTWLKMRRENGAVLHFSNFAHHKAYPWSEHIKSLDLPVQLAVPKSAWQLVVVDSCNKLADDLRAEGLTDAQIFAQDRVITYGLEAVLKVEMSGPDDLALEQASAPFPDELEVVCQKWSGAIPQTAGTLAVQQPEVVNLGLNILEQATQAGTCRIRLDGWVTTDLKNADIDIQFENDEGKKSPVQTVNTGVSKTATFSRWEDVPNHPQGQVRIVGDGFQSAWVDYDLDCVQGGPNTVVSNSPPLVTLTLVPSGEVMVLGLICPKVVKLVGVLVGRGNVEGKAVFFGKGYLSPLRNYSITHGQKVLLGAEAELNWNAIVPLYAGMKPKSMNMSREFGLNVTNSDNKVIASVPRRWYSIECKQPKLNPVVQVHPGGLTNGKNDPQQSGVTAPRQLRVLPQASPPAPPEGIGPRHLRRLRKAN